MSQASVAWAGIWVLVGLFLLALIYVLSFSAVDASDPLDDDND